MLVKNVSVAALVTITAITLSSAVERMTASAAGGSGWPSTVGQTCRTAAVLFVTALLAQALLSRRSRSDADHPAAESHRTEPPMASPASAGDQPRTPTMDVCGSAGRPDDWDEVIGDEINEIAPLADHVYAMKSLVGYEAELDDTPFVRVDDLRWLLANYVIKGGRVRRLTSLPRLLTGGVGSAHQTELHRTATALLHAIRNTNAHVADWLLAHRVAIPNPDLLDTNALLDRHLTMSIEPMTVSADPLYLLTCHIHDVLEAAETLGDLEHPLVESLEVGLVRPLNAIDHELTATMAFNAAVLASARTARSQTS